MMSYRAISPWLVVSNWTICATRTSRPGWWTGDVWKPIGVLQKYRPDPVIDVLDAEPTGLALVQTLCPTPPHFRVSSMRSCERGRPGQTKPWCSPTFGLGFGCTPPPPCRTSGRNVGSHPARAVIPRAASARGAHAWRRYPGRRNRRVSRGFRGTGAVPDRGDCPRGMSLRGILWAWCWCWRHWRSGLALASPHCKWTVSAASPTSWKSCAMNSANDATDCVSSAASVRLSLSSAVASSA
jgi:hypothetical protein